MKLSVSSSHCGLFYAVFLVAGMVWASFQLTNSTPPFMSSLVKVQTSTVDAGHLESLYSRTLASNIVLLWVFWLLLFRQLIYFFPKMTMIQLMFNRVTKSFLFATLMIIGLTIWSIFVSYAMFNSQDLDFSDYNRSAIQLVVLFLGGFKDFQRLTDNRTMLMIVLLSMLIFIGKFLVMHLPVGVVVSFMHEWDLRQHWAHHALWLERKANLEGHPEILEKTYKFRKISQRGTDPIPTNIRKAKKKKSRAIDLYNWVDSKLRPKDDRTNFKPKKARFRLNGKKIERRTDVDEEAEESVDSDLEVDMSLWLNPSNPFLLTRAEKRDWVEKESYARREGVEAIMQYAPDEALAFNLWEKSIKLARKRQAAALAAEGRAEAIRMAEQQSNEDILFLTTTTEKIQKRKVRWWPFARKIQ
eukprot:Platyproteum_vivax@DN6049_c0_g1_i2.p1